MTHTNVNTIERLFFRINVILDDDFQNLVDETTYNLDYDVTLPPTSKIFPTIPGTTYVVEFHCFAEQYDFEYVDNKLVEYKDGVVDPTGEPVGYSFPRRHYFDPSGIVDPQYEYVEFE